MREYGAACAKSVMARAAHPSGKRQQRGGGTGGA